MLLLSVLSGALRQGMTDMGSTPWTSGRFRGTSGTQQVLFGRMFEDPAVELENFAGTKKRIVCIASAGDTMRALLEHGHEVVGVDINPVQIEYARQRLAGAGAVHGRADRILALARAGMVLAGWNHNAIRSFLDLTDTTEQIAVWNRQFRNRRSRMAFALSFRATLRLAYSRPLAQVVGKQFDISLWNRLERGFATHPNVANPWASYLLLGIWPKPTERPVELEETALVCADLMKYLSQQEPNSVDGFTLSNILDGPDAAYQRALLTEVGRAVRPDGITILRSFGEPRNTIEEKRAAADRSLLWGRVVVANGKEVSAAWENSTS